VGGAGLPQHLRDAGDGPPVIVGLVYGPDELGKVACSPSRTRRFMPAAILASIVA
jgi:hypothetical protein